MNANDRRILDAADFVREGMGGLRRGSAQRRATADGGRPRMVQNAIVAERAEKRAARADVAAGIGRLVADGLTVQQMTELCGVPAADIWRITSRHRIGTAPSAADCEPPRRVVSPGRHQVTIHSRRLPVN